MSSKQKNYDEATQVTAYDLRTIARSDDLKQLSSLSLPEIDTAVERIARLMPAGNVPGMILSGLARLSGRRSSSQLARRDVNLLFSGVESVLDKAVYGTFFAGPAAVIWAYQQLLKMAGKDLDESFPEGLWQFYADYSLREDTARYGVETHGFDTVLRYHQIPLSPVNRVTAWVMAAITTLHQYHEWLANEWRERVYTTILQNVVQGTPYAAQFDNLYKEWCRQRPYGRGKDVGSTETYAAYRRRHFDTFLRAALEQLDEQTRYAWNRQVQNAKLQLTPYQQQLSVLAYLEPNSYGEVRQPLALSDACVGLIYQDRYYLIPACAPGGDQPATVYQVQAHIAAMMRQPTGRSAMRLSSLATLRRQAWATLRSDLNETLRQSLDQLRCAPILINADIQSAQAPLTDIRQAERGVGDHPLTIFDAQNRFVFDFSHIFFDGAWAAALAEIMTREALSWAVYLRDKVADLPEETAVGSGPTLIRPLRLPFERQESIFIQKAERVAVEVSAEAELAQVKPILALRKLFKMRSDLLQLTVNDLLILYRAIHAVTYQLDARLLAALNELGQDSRMETAVQQALLASQPYSHSPAIMIPIDAGHYDPKERIYPLVFEVPLQELNLLSLHQQTLSALATYQQANPGTRSQTYATFDQLQRDYLATLAGFGQVLSHAQVVAMQAESSSQAAMKLLAHLPVPLQRLLDQIPNRFDVLNDLIKGREVFSNVGAVATGSTLTRFSSAKDDNEKKTLVWGIITDANQVMRLSLRDFRPHVAQFIAAGQRQLAQQLTQHYLDSYARGLNGFIDELQRITRTSRETQLDHYEQPG